MQQLSLPLEIAATDEFVHFFSGDTAYNSAIQSCKGWATPYALSIYGQFQNNQQCPFQDGTGYGDGRAISVAEVIADDGSRWELQLKGAG